MYSFVSFNGFALSAVLFKLYKVYIKNGLMRITQMPAVTPYRKLAVQWDETVRGNGPFWLYQLKYLNTPFTFPTTVTSLAIIGSM